MKRLRNTGIYYLIFGILLAVSYVFSNLWPISILGVLLLSIFLVLKYFFKEASFAFSWNKRALQLLDVLLIALPFIYVALISWYVWRPYRQTVILPNNYEGIVAVKYNVVNSQDEIWTSSFFGLCGSRLIKVDTSGIARTSFKFHDNSVPLLGIKQMNYNREGLKIYYEHNLDDEIVEGFDGTWLVNDNTEESGKQIYSTDYNYYPLMIFVVAQPEQYFDYFMTAKEIEIWLAKDKKKYPNSYIEQPTHKLNARSSKFLRKAGIL
ncbi:hypothetical protein [Cellulophaga baltica]|uniref:Uncharacterized protein n=1 Tax=Cellulophaga baltica TaxID=76594 RepID=A0A1G7J2V6_9FLAO|nr:hypothetical protein [Cellulophaga baltica]SDF19317.1 hypothetical protein SAMN04487992_108181 [Cellulophaga baltica]